MSESSWNRVDIFVVSGLNTVTPSLLTSEPSGFLLTLAAAAAVELLILGVWSTLSPFLDKTVEPLTSCEPSSYLTVRKKPLSFFRLKPTLTFSLSSSSAGASLPRCWSLSMPFMLIFSFSLLLLLLLLLLFAVKQPLIWCRCCWCCCCVWFGIVVLSSLALTSNFLNLVKLRPDLSSICCTGLAVVLTLSFVELIRFGDQAPINLCKYKSFMSSRRNF